MFSKTLPLMEKPQLWIFPLQPFYNNPEQGGERDLRRINNVLQETERSRLVRIRMLKRGVGVGGGGRVGCVL